MKVLKDIVGLEERRITDGLYGVEIEVEGERLPPPNNVDSSIWRMEHDGSLKTEEAWEYVMPKPKCLEGVRESLDYLEEKYIEYDSNVYDSVRAGVHVHMNVQNYTIVELVTFATCYYLAEDLLMEYCGPYRSGNLFTLRSRDAEYNLICLYKALQEKNLRHINTENIRYASLNYLSLFRYGSLEFRGMRGTRNLDDIYQWVEIIDDLRQGAQAYRNPADVIASMSGEGEWEFIKRVFPNTHHLFKQNDNSIKSIREAARRVQMIAFEIDWETISSPNHNIFEDLGGF